MEKTKQDILNEINAQEALSQNLSAPVSLENQQLANVFKTMTLDDLRNASSARIKIAELMQQLPDAK